jgi:FkbM family methyltransferase
MKTELFSNFNNILNEVILVKVMTIREILIWKIRNIPRYTPGRARTKMGIIEYLDVVTFRSGLKEIFVDEIYKVKKFSSQNPVVIDCGANIGLASIYFSKVYNANVYAYEADPEIFECLIKNVANLSLQEKVFAFNKAVWVNNQGVDFDIEGGYSGQIKKGGHELVKKTIRVPSIRLRKIISDFDHIDFLKIDIEGAENQAILDCAGILNKIDYIFIEWHSYAADSQMLGDILNLLKTEGFRYHIKEAFTSKEPFIKVEKMCGMDLQLNIFAFRNGLVHNQ